MNDKITLARITVRLLFGDQIIPNDITVVRLFRAECGLSFDEAKIACRQEFILRGWTVQPWLIPIDERVRELGL